MNIRELKTKWNKEKEDYKTREVGSGVQKFVKDFLKSEDIFNLKEGLSSTPLERRNNEFTEETKTKARRLADIIIYINPEINIPLEVEQYGNIENGLSQLLQYQLDLDKKYGILTDGYTWQFYNNAYLLKEFNLKQIFENPELFREYWEEYIKPEFYYLSFFEEKGQLKIIPEDISIDKKRQDFFRDITTLIRDFKNKLEIEGYLETTDKKQKGKIAIEITYAYIIQFILYKTLVDNDFSSFKKEFTDIQNGIYECLKVKQYGKILGIIDGISNEISKNIYRPFAKEQEFITNKLIELLRKPKNELHDVSPWLDIFVFIKKYNFANVRNEIFGYIYENYLKELYKEEQKGQYFTDPDVVNFMLKQIGYNPENIKKRLDNNPEENYISIIDPSCGSGTFLYSAVNQIINAVPNGSENSSKEVEELVNENVFGLDIAEFPLYLAEMNIVMRMLPLIINEKYNNPIDKKIKVFWTKDSISEFIFSEINNTENDLMGIGGGQRPLFNIKKLEFEFDSYMREKGDLENTKKSMRPPRKRFDYVIGNPPYIGYNESSKQGVLIVKLIQDKKVQMSDIYGVNLNTVPNRIKPYSPKPNLYAFFIALGIALLKDNGKLCYIIPQTLLNAGDLDVLRYHLAKFTTLEKIIIFSGKMFIGRGLKQDKPVPTSSLIFVLSRKIPLATNKVKVINYKNPDDNIEETLQNILKGEKISEKEIPQEELLQNVANWNFIKQEKKFLNFHEEYKKNTIDISSFRVKLTPNDDFSFDGGVIINEDSIKNRANDDCFEIFDYKTNDWDAYTISKSEKYYPINGSFEFPSGSQGIATFHKKFKIIWRTRFANRFQFTDRNILLINNQSLTVSSNSKNELLFYFSLLNSPITKLILEENLRQENEKDYFIPLRAIKEFVRIPKITDGNQKIKNEIINSVEKMLKLGEETLSHFVDFSKVMLQKFDNVSVESNNLILEKDKEKIKIHIKGGKNLVKKTIDEKYNSKGLKLEKSIISLSELKTLPIIDYDKQQELKNYIDDLVFALYFNIGLEGLGLNKAEKIKAKCSKNPYYKLVNTQKL
ncbi:MAG: Eco57I restriction-modification methylase domain-containing protein [Candidatus Nealsonbacteria bacterium]|nr:Eco57I restriction-modification methylase domain-containing protein [Candidatus Nealsonbacteria bacterium]